MRISGDYDGTELIADITQHTNPDVLMKVERLVSLDNGVTWIPGGAFTRQGGVSLDKDGLPATHCSIVVSHAAVKDPLVKTVIEIIGGDLRTSVDSTVKTRVVG